MLKTRFKTFFAPNSNALWSATGFSFLPRSLRVEEFGAACWTDAAGAKTTAADQSNDHYQCYEYVASECHSDRVPVQHRVAVVRLARLHWELTERLDDPVVAYTQSDTRYKYTCIYHLFVNVQYCICTCTHHVCVFFVLFVLWVDVKCRPIASFNNAISGQLVELMPSLAGCRDC